MALPDGSVGNTQISMGQMRTEFRNDDNPILMNQLYRGGGLVPSTQSGTSTTTVGASISSLAGSPSVTTGTSGNFFNNNQAQLTGTITCGNNGNVTANGAITFVNSGSNSNSDNGTGGTMTGGVKIVSSNATVTNSSGGHTGTLYASFTGSQGTWTGTRDGSGTFTTTISSGTSLGIPNGVTSFKILTHGSCSAYLTGQNEGTAGLSLGNGSGSITSTTTTSTTTNINQSVPPSGEIEFEDMYGAFDV